MRGGARTSNSSLNARVLCGLQALLASLGRDESPAEQVGADPGCVVDSALPVMEPVAGTPSAGGLLAGLRELVDSMSRPDPGDLLDLLRAFVAKAEADLRPAAKGSTRPAEAVAPVVAPRGGPRRPEVAAGSPASKKARTEVAQPGPRRPIASVDPTPPWRRQTAPAPGRPQHRGDAATRTWGPTMRRALAAGPPVRLIGAHWHGDLVRPADLTVVVNAAKPGARIVSGVCDFLPAGTLGLLVLDTISVSILLRPGSACALDTMEIMAPAANVRGLVSGIAGGNLAHQRTGSECDH